MKVLVVGASGMIGGEALLQSLAFPGITKVIAFVRRPLSGDISENPKLESVVIEDFARWPEDILRKHSDAAGMIWAIGTNVGVQTVDYEYPLAFLESMTKVLVSVGRQDPLKFVLLSGKLVRQDQETALWFLEQPRKLKGRLEIKTLELQKADPNIWKVFIVKPGGVAPRNPREHGILGMMTYMAAVLGENWSVQGQALGAFMAYLAVDGGDEESIILNARIVHKGNELLQHQN